MKSFLLAFAFSTTLLAQPIDLGFIGPNKAIRLESTSPDLTLYSLDFIPRANSNNLAFTTTNELITVKDLEQLPQGHITMGVKSVHSFVAESPVSIYTFTLIKATPDAPKATAVFIPYTQTTTNTLTNTIYWMRVAQPIPEPPKVDDSIYNATNVSNVIITNNPYMRKIEEQRPKPMRSASDIYYNRGNEKRRSE